MTPDEVVPTPSKAVSPFCIPEIVKELTAAGILPKECRRFSLVMEPAAIIRLSFEVNATREQVQAIADALIRNPEEARSIARFVAFPPPQSNSDGPASVTVEL